MMESKSIEITQQTLLVELRRIDPVTDFDRYALSNDPVVHHLGICLDPACARDRWTVVMLNTKADLLIARAS